MAVSRERLDALYNELFGRTTGAEDAGAQYWMESGLSGEALRDALIAGAQGGDRANYLAQQQAFANRGATAEDVNKIYIELFGRPAEQAGIDYWMQSGETGENLRDAIAYSGFTGGTQDAAVLELCAGTNVIHFGSASATNTESNLVNAMSAVDGWSAGWAKLDLTADNERVLGDLGGLPVTGFAVVEYQNGALGSGTLANYQMAWEHKTSIASSSGTSSRRLSTLISFCLNWGK